ncbi:MAG: NAD-dependent epimerase/dehydratase family protein [Anaerolineae bacterium]|nr:NAD-dependent epimerase/dehydratase family protein [Anaerolineae bacterium]
MNVLILGIDGYLGWPLAQWLAAAGHTVCGVDNFLRRKAVQEMGSISAIPIADWADRASAFEACYSRPITFYETSLLDYERLVAILGEMAPDAIVHLGEIPSAAYSMRDAEHAALTQHNNVIGSLNLLWAMRAACPDAHLLKLGTMGEYGTPNIAIPEGFFEVEFRGRKDILPFPRQAGSIYHLSKVHDSHNALFAAKTWGLRITDVMQGVVYGTRTDPTPPDERFATPLDFDECLGPAINRFVCQAVIDCPLTIYGSGSQTRGFLPLSDSLRCLELALLNPPNRGEYRVFNQFEYTYSISALADVVKQEATALGMPAQIEHLANPRSEREEHFYQPDREHLVRLGYEPHDHLTQVVRGMLEDVRVHRSRIEPYAQNMRPSIQWS